MTATCSLRQFVQSLRIKKQTNILTCEAGAAEQMTVSFFASFPASSGSLQWIFLA